MITKAHTALSQALDSSNPKRLYSQGKLADALGVTQPAVSGWCAGKSRPEHQHVRLAIERLLGIPANDWMTDEERETATGTGGAAAREFAAACGTTPRAPASAPRAIDDADLSPTGTK